MCVCVCVCLCVCVCVCMCEFIHSFIRVWCYIIHRPRKPIIDYKTSTKDTQVPSII